MPSAAAASLRADPVFPLRGRDAFLRDNALRTVTVPADGSCGFKVVYVSMGIIQPPPSGWHGVHTHHTRDLMN
jgi:hypothetical protein